MARSTCEKIVSIAKSCAGRRVSRDYAVRTGRVEDFDRERSAVDLVMFALETLNPLRRSMTMRTPTP